MPRLNVITRTVSKAVEKCELTCFQRVPISYERTMEHHNSYVAVFEDMIKDGYDINLVKMPALDEFADSMFMEDVAMLYPECAILTRPGAASRRGEVDFVVEEINKIRPKNMRIQEPGTVDGGDVLYAGKYVFMGKSTRTNVSAYEQMREYLAPFGIECVQEEITGCLHMKCAATCLDWETILLNPTLVNPEIFTSRGYRVIEAFPEERHAGNIVSFVAEKDGKALRTLIYPKAYPKTLERIQAFVDECNAKGNPTRVVVIEVDEIAKAEGDVTCCSLLSYD